MNPSYRREVADDLTGLGLLPEVICPEVIEAG